MGKPNEQSGGTQQRAGSAKDDARAKGEATKTKERAELEKRAHDLSVDLDSVRGTGPGGQVTLLDVEFAHIHSRYCRHSSQEPCPPCKPPSEEDILEQYVVLQAALAGPIRRVDLETEQICVKPDASGKCASVITVVDTANNKLNFPFTYTPCNFFAPMPPLVKWNLPKPQPLLSSCLPGTCQPCTEGQCDLNIDIGANLDVRGASQQPAASSAGGTSGRGRSV